MNKYIGAVVAFMGLIIIAPVVVPLIGLVGNSDDADITQGKLLMVIIGAVLVAAGGAISRK
jgi:hypothetical protein